MAHFMLLFPNDYIGAHDLMGKDVTKTIARVLVEDLRCQSGKVERKPVLVFKDSKKKLVLNKTNARTIAGIHGPDTERWAGKRVTMYPTTTKLGRDTVDCVRVRSKAPAGPPSEIPADENPFEIEAGSEVEQ